jgi:hypothetical protein
MRRNEGRVTWTHAQASDPIEDGSFHGHYALSLGGAAQRQIPRSDKGVVYARSEINLEAKITDTDSNHGYGESKDTTRPVSMVLKHNLQEVACHVG